MAPPPGCRRHRHCRSSTVPQQPLPPPTGKPRRATRRPAGALMRKSPGKKPTEHNGSGQLRIIGGEWRSRQFSFPMAQGLRPTPNRVRETLFNWLAPYVEGAPMCWTVSPAAVRCFEALSRGASSALAVDSNSNAVASLRQILATLKCSNGQVTGQSPCSTWKASRPRPMTCCSSTRPSVRTCWPRPVRWRKKAGWPGTPGSTPKAKPPSTPGYARQLAPATASRRPTGVLRAPGEAQLDSNRTDHNGGLRARLESASPQTAICKRHHPPGASTAHLARGQPLQRC